MRGRDARGVPIAEVLLHYAADKADHVARPREFAARIEALSHWWAGKTMDDVTSTTCRAYWQSRASLSMARRELEDLRAACRLAIADNVCRQAVRVTLPPKAKARVEFLTRSEVAKLIWTAYREKEVQRGVPTKRRPLLHVARFILIALYTGSRSHRVWAASFTREQGRPWLDLDEGIYYRAAAGEAVAHNKQAPPVRITARLLAHLRRWRAMGANYACEYNGAPADPKRAFGRLARRVFGADRTVVRHTLRHTAATWLMQGRADKWEAAGYLGMTLETLEAVYGHHHPDHQGTIEAAFSKAGRRQKREKLPLSLP